MFRRLSWLWLVIIVMGCTSEYIETLDDELRFAINTSKNSKGIASYQMPGSMDFNRIPQDPNNTLTIEKVQLGQLLFHETAFSTTGRFEQLRQTYSCASCHHAAAGFQAGMIQGIGDGGIGYGAAGEGRLIDFEVPMSEIDVQPLRAVSAMNGAFQTNMLWDGQFGATAVNIGTEEQWEEGTPKAINHLGYEGLETQAIAGLEVHRMHYSPDSIDKYGYKDLFDRALGNLQEDMRYSNTGAGLAIAAYQRTLMSSAAPFQQWLRGTESAMTEAQKHGANLFFGKAQCNNCHYGPSLAGMEFHAVGFEDFDVDKVANFDPDDPTMKGRGNFTKKEEDDYKFKVPQLYNLKDNPFYGHGGTFTSIREVIDYKNLALSLNDNVRENQLSEFFVPLELTDEEVTQLTDFIENALYDDRLDRYVPSSVKSNLCFPNNDLISRIDLGCD